MKRISTPDPFTVSLRDLNEQPLLNDKGKGVTMSFAQYLRALIAIPVFAEGLDAIDATELRLKLKAKFDRYTEENEFVDLEDDHYRKLLAALKASQPDPRSSWCFVHFMHAIRDAKELPEAA